MAEALNNTEVGSKLVALEESVRDVSDLLYCLKKLPTLHIVDDPCQLPKKNVDSTENPPIEHSDNVEDEK